jgi:hypothetical protein
VEFNLNTVWEVVARLVDYHMPACHEKQSLIALKEKTAGIR